MQLQIRRLLMEDYDALYTLWTKTPGVGLRSLDDSREGIAGFLKRNPSTCFAAVLDDRLVGCILCGHDGRRGYIYHAVVEEALRGQGIGRRLVENAQKALIEEGIHKVALVAFAKNENGNAFWEKMGYTKREDLAYRNRSLNDENR